MSKTIRIEFIFSDTEWTNLKKRFKLEGSIRQALYEGALGEVDQLMRGSVYDTEEDVKWNEE